MEFCPRCSSILSVRKIKSTKSGRVCSKCGYEIQKNLIKPSALKVINHLKVKQEIAVITEKETQLRTLPTVKNRMPKV